jgi:hypothetical protein
MGGSCPESATGKKLDKTQAAIWESTHFSRYKKHSCLRPYCLG